MRHGLNSLILVGLMSLSTVPAAHADRLLVEDLRQINLESVEAPRLGQTMQQVETHFGPPRERVAAVGNPPIGRWIYDSYTVYFENNRVLHTVLQR